jgi:hypothetical protein
VVKAPANDYDGDGRSDVAVYSPADGTYHIRYSGGGSAVTQFGAPGDRPFDPGTRGLRRRRPGGPGGVHARGRQICLPALRGRPRCCSRRSARPGRASPIPAPGDYDGDGKADLAVYLTGPGALAVRPSAGGPDRIVPFGTPGIGRPIPAPGDYDGDGKADPAVYLAAFGRVRLPARPAADTT